MRLPASDQIKRRSVRFWTSVGEDPQRDGLKNTPARVARMYEELLHGYHTDPTALINGALFDVDYDEMVVVKDIEYYSLCEHHLLPFYGVAHVAYIPRDKVLGLSKIPRVVDMFARRLQVQERMTRQIADFSARCAASAGRGGGRGGRAPLLHDARREEGQCAHGHQRRCWAASNPTRARAASSLSTSESIRSNE